MPMTTDPGARPVLTVRLHHRRRKRAGAACAVLVYHRVGIASSDPLRLNVTLAEAIALGHDCGHGPAGHASEDALACFLPEGFDHAVWGADVSLAGLNLCDETLDGIRNHSWSRPAPATAEGEGVSTARPDRNSAWAIGRRSSSSPMST